MPTYRRRGQLYKRPARRRGRHHLTYVPREGMFCVGEEARGSGFKPLVCHRFFQDALEDQDIPLDQGMTTSGAPRAILCDGKRITDTAQVPYKRSDELPIYQITKCRNLTRKTVWLGGQWTEVEEKNLDGFLEEPTTRNILLGTAALAALITWLGR